MGGDDDKEVVKKVDDVILALIVWKGYNKWPKTDSRKSVEGHAHIEVAGVTPA